MPPRAAKKSKKSPAAAKPKTTKASSNVVEDEKVPVEIETSSVVAEVLPTFEEVLPIVNEEETIVEEEVTTTTTTTTRSVVEESIEIRVTEVEEPMEIKEVEELTVVREVDVSMAEELVVLLDPVPDVADVGKNDEITEEANDDTNVTDGAQMELEEGAKHDLVEEETGVGEAEDTEEGEDDSADVDDDIDRVEDGEDDNADVDDCGDKVGDGEDDNAGVVNGNDGVEDGDKDESDDDEDNEEDPSVYMHAPLTESKKQKEFEIFVGGLDKEAVEDDLIKVFGEFGEIQAARIVKHPVTQKSKGFAFIRYATAEQANKALNELKDGTEVRGKRVGISASQDKDTLYLGNICKTWTKDHVLETLKGFGVDQIEEVILPDDPKNVGKSKGFAFLEFGSHADAMAAFQRLRKPDAVLGCDRSAKVAFAQPSNPSEEALSQVKTVYVEGLPDSWDEEKLKEHCKQYGEIKKVQLSRNFTSTKRKDFGFVSFTSRESAIACVEGINNAQLGEGEIKVKANLAKPQNKGRLAKQAARGGFKVNKDGVAEEAGVSKMKGRAKGAEGKVKAHSKSKSAKGGKQSKFQGVVAEGQGGGPSKPKRMEFHQKKGQPFKNGKRGRRGGETESSSRPSKKARNNRNFASGNGRSRPNSGFGNQRNPRFGKSKAHYAARSAAPRGQYAAGYAGPATSYQGHPYGAVSGPKGHYPDMEPHAGYIEPVAKQGRDPYGYGQTSSAGYGSQATSGAVYGGGPAVAPSYVPEYSSYAGAGYEGGYGYPNSGAYAPRRPYY
eukprot:TRINITY_DN499_c0_g3_i2.p1 TRINITY_DN499_c0_g3~~TRINITY_DN499_c0_g3_i2.p1  ORF type:complete len:781 (-),score=224.86 TRINITY_DN499_c0_g3_i2:533-2875(-)